MKWSLSRWFPSPTANKAKATQPPKRRLRLEVLEDRCVPATLHVTNLTSDSAATAGTLRYEIVNSVANDTIVFDVAGTLTLTNGALVPTHALSIKGLGPTKDTINAGAGTNNIFYDTSAALTLSGLTLTGAHGTSNGGAVYSYGGLLTIDNCTISGNTSTGEGGGIYAYKGLTLTNSTVTGNSTTDDGGGIYARGTTMIVNSTISGNTATGNEGGGGIGFESGNGPLTIIGSTISGNKAILGAGVYIGHERALGIATIKNSTITGNIASGAGGGIYVQTFGTLNLVNDTIVGNTSKGGVGGGGLAVVPYRGNVLAVNVVNTIVANNLDTSIHHALDIAGTVKATHSLIRSTKDTVFAAGSSANIFGVDPHLGPLQNNGGPTMTMALLANSVAIDAGDDSVTGPPNGLTTDQRGHARKVGKHVDIGAFEFQPPPHRRGRIF